MKRITKVLSVVAVIVVSSVQGVNVGSVAADSGGATGSVGSLASQISAGANHTCAVVEGDVYCWGSNASGQLGAAEDIAGSTVPVKVAGVSGARAVAAGNDHSCAIIVDGQVACWGSNSDFQLGRSTAGGSNATVVAALAGATVITAGPNFTCVIVSPSSGVKCWGSAGRDDFAFYGTRYSVGTPLGRLTVDRGPSGFESMNYDDYEPGYVIGLESGVVGIAAGGSFDLFGCALMATGSVRCWGGNGQGQLGNGTAQPTVPSAMTTDITVPVTGITDAIAITAGVAHACAVTESRGIKCWGSGFVGQLGVNNQDVSQTPVSVWTSRSSSSPFTDAAQVSGSAGFGEGYSCAVKTTGAGFCWGGNANGELGSGADSPYILAPVPVVDITDIAVITPGADHACSMSSKRVVHCWGAGSNGRLGNGSSENALRPTLVKGVVPQSVTFGALSSKTLNDAPFALSATSSAGGPVTFSSTTTSVCSVSGSTLTVLATGTCSISATAGEYGLYAASSAVTQSFDVAGAKPIVSTGSALATATRATLNGTVNARGISTSVSFVYGTSPTLAGATTVKGADQSEDTNKEVSISVADLKVKTTYYYRVEATNALGSAQGDIKSFTTTNPEGVTINDGDEFTNSTKVVVSVVASATGAKAELSNDGGFKNSKTFDLVNGVADIPWTLVSSKDGTFTKIVYVRVVSRFGTNLPVVSDDIILDTSKPVVAAVEAKAVATSNKSVVVARAKKSGAGVKLTVRGSDTVSGVGAIEVRTSARKPATTVTIKKVKGKLDGKPRALSQSVNLATSAKSLQFRIVDRAGNASKWATVKVG